MGCKVCSVLEKYDCEYYDERLVEQWTAPASERKGYRQLARWLNINLLRQVMDRAGLSTMAGDVEPKYEHLQEDSPEAAELRAHLANEGIPIDELTADFVSYGVVRRHLKECLDAERASESSNWESDAISIAEDHAQTKIEEAVRSLINKGHVELTTETTVHVTAEIECENCHARIPVDRALRRGYVCSCGSDTRE